MFRYRSQLNRWQRCEDGAITKSYEPSREASTVPVGLFLFQHLDFSTLIRVSKTHTDNLHLVERVFRNMVKSRSCRLSYVSARQQLNIFYDDIKVAVIAYGAFLAIALLNWKVLTFRLSSVITQLANQFTSKSVNILRNL